LRWLALLLVVVTVWRPTASTTPRASPRMPYESDSAGQALPIVGIFGRGGAARLARLDPRTLKRLQSPHPLRIGGYSQSATLSPDRSRVALAGSRGVAVVDAKRLRIVRTIRGSFDASEGLLWPGGTVLIAVGSSKFGYEYAFLGSDVAVIDTDAEPVALVREGVVLMAGPTYVEIVGRYESSAELMLPAGAAFAVAADTHRDRFFVLSAGGLIAELDHVEELSYHSVTLSGHRFQAAWAGRGRIALWGADGLGLIDTRDWSAHAVAPAVTDVIPTASGLVAWNRNGDDGLAVYRPDGSLRFRRLTGKAVGFVVSLGLYAYVTVGDRFSVNMRTGRVSGPLASKARIVVPDIVDIP
jgi:hypothetical protein